MTHAAVFLIEDIHSFISNGLELPKFLAITESNNPEWDTDVYRFIRLDGETLNEIMSDPGSYARNFTISSDGLSVIRKKVVKTNPLCVVAGPAPDKTDVHFVLVEDTLYMRVSNNEVLTLGAIHVYGTDKEDPSSVVFEHQLNTSETSIIIDGSLFGIDKESLKDRLELMIGNPVEGILYTYETI